MALDRLSGIDGGAVADAQLWAAERQASVGRVVLALERCLETLDEEDRTILRLKYRSGLTVAGVARALRIPQRPLIR